jgi:hypothetical protein
MAKIYGDNGNRWWVGLNVESDQSTILGTGSILSPNGYESLPSGNAVDDVKFAAAAIKDKNATHPVTISVENVDWYNINGPYITQKAADAAIPGIQRGHPAAGEAQQLLNEAAQGNGQSGANSNPVANPLTAIGNFFSIISQEATWERVAEGLAGLILLYVAFKGVTGVDPIAPVKKAAKVAAIF